MFLTIKEVMRRTGLSRSTIYEQMGNEEFPLSYRLTKRRVGWKESEIEQWIETRMTAPIKFGAHRGRQVVRQARATHPGRKS
jgi:prophage regulatory protein